VGLSENIMRDRYFNSVKCISKTGLVYYVDARIIRIFVEADANIRENKNLLLFNKYKVLSDALLKQRKSYLDSFCSFQIDSVKERENAISKFTKKNKGLFHSKTKYNKKFELHTPKNVCVKEKNKKIECPKENVKCRSLSAVCEVLSKVSRRTTLDDQRREKSLLFRKKYLAEKEKNKKVNQSQKMKETKIASDIKQQLEFQKGNFLCFKKERLKKSMSSANILRDRKLKLKSINENSPDDEGEGEGDAPPFEKLPDLVPLHHSLWKNFALCNTNVFWKNNYRGAIHHWKKKALEEDKERINKIRLDRKELVYQKMKKIYTTDLEKILSNDHLIDKDSVY